MPHRHGTSLINPMIGVYFGIFAAFLAGAVILLLIFEQLGTSDWVLRIAMAVIPATLFALVGAGGYTARPREFLTSARRVPAFYNGLSLAVMATGGAGLVGIVGALFLTGFDALFIGLGIVAGLTTSVLVIAPFLRKFGAPTVSGYLGQRFESGPVRLLAATIAVVPLMLLAIAEIKIAVVALTTLTPLAPAAAALTVSFVLLATVLPGGVRSLTWSSAAQSLAVLFAILLPAAIAAVMETNLPFGQLSHGPLIRSIGRLETLQEVPVPVAGWMTFEVPGAGLQPISGRFASVFGSIGPIAFVLATLSILMGVAGSPALLSRAVITPTVFETRKSIGWAVAILGVLLMTFSSIAVFERDFLMSEIAGQIPDTIPPALRQLADLGIAALPAGQGKISATSVQFDRDSMLVALPVVMGMPQAVMSLITAGVFSAALAAAALSLTQIGIVIGEDVINAPRSWLASDFNRVNACRIAIVVAVGLACGGALLAGDDPLALLLTAFAFSGSTLFPVLLLSIWWKRTNAFGAMAGLASGFAVALMVVLMADLAGIGLPAAMAPAAAVPISILVTMLVSRATPAPQRQMLEMVRDLRIPGGETIYDRQARQSRQRGPRA